MGNESCHSLGKSVVLMLGISAVMRNCAEAVLYGSYDVKTWQSPKKALFCWEEEKKGQTQSPRHRTNSSANLCLLNPNLDHAYTRRDNLFDIRPKIFSKEVNDRVSPPWSTSGTNPDPAHLSDAVGLLLGCTLRKGTCLYGSVRVLRHVIHSEQ